MKWIAMVFAALCFASASAQQLYTAGKDYQLIEPAQPTDKASHRSAMLGRLPVL